MGEDEAQPRPSEPHERGSLAPVFFTALLLAAIAALFYVLRSFIPDLILTFILVAMFRPLWRRVSERMGGRQWLASGVVTMVIVLIVAAPVAFVLTTLVTEAMAMVQRVHAGNSAAFANGVGQRAESALRSVGVSIQHKQLVRVAIRARDWLAAHVLKEATAMLSSTLSLIFHFLVIVISVFYVLVDADRLKKFVFALSPLPDDQDQLLAKKFDDVARGILVGNGVGSALQGILGGAAMAVVGLPSPMLWGTIMTLFAFLPLVGISVVTVPAALYLAFTGHVGKAVGFIIFCTAQGVFIENVVKTRLIGRSTRMHDLLVFLSVLGGIGTFGIMGLLYGPLIVAAFLTLSELYFKVYREQIAAQWHRSA